MQRQRCLEPVWTQGLWTPSSAPLSVGEQMASPARTGSPPQGEAASVILMCHQALPSSPAAAGAAVAGPAPEPGVSSPARALRLRPPRPAALGPGFPPYTGRAKGAVESQTAWPCGLQAPWLSLLSPLPAQPDARPQPARVLWRWGDPKGSFLLEQRQTVQVGGRDGEAQASTGGKCPCPQAGTGQGVSLPSAGRDSGGGASWHATVGIAHTSSATGPFQTGHQLSVKSRFMASCIRHQRQKDCLIPTSPPRCPEPSRRLEKTSSWEQPGERHSNPAAFPSPPSLAFLLSQAAQPVPNAPSVN